MRIPPGVIRRRPLLRGLGGLALSTGCVSNAPPADGPPLPLIHPEEVVPAFTLRTIDGDTIDSATLVGKEAFVVFYFATWCGWCERKLPLLQQAVTHPDTRPPVIGISIDHPEERDELETYIDKYDVQFPVVLGYEHRAFTVAFNPFRGVPFVLVVDPLGYPFHVQRGYHKDDGLELAMAIAAARQRTGRET